MPADKSGDQVLKDVHDDANDALRTVGASGVAPSAEILREDVPVHDLSGAAMDSTTTLASKGKISQILFHSTVALNEQVEIWFESKTASYPTMLVGGADGLLAGEADLVFIPESEMRIESGDEIRIKCTNAGASGLVYATVMGEVLD
jgi:hypothetical protein